MKSYLLIVSTADVKVVTGSLRIYKVLLDKVTQSCSTHLISFNVITSATLIVYQIAFCFVFKCPYCFLSCDAETEKTKTSANTDRQHLEREAETRFGKICKSITDKPQLPHEGSSDTE